VQKLINQLKQLSRTEYIDPAAFVGIYVRFGDKDQAFAWLEKGYEERTGMTSLKVNPIFDSIRSDPRFHDLMRKVGLAN